MDEKTCGTFVRAGLVVALASDAVRAPRFRREALGTAYSVRRRLGDG